MERDCGQLRCSTVAFSGCKMVEYFPQVGRKLLPSSEGVQVSLGLIEMGRQGGATSAVLLTLYRAAVVQAAEMSFLQWVAGLSLSNRARSSEEAAITVRYNLPARLMLHFPIICEQDPELPLLGAATHSQPGGNNPPF